MRSTFAVSAVLFSALQLATAQTFTDCNPLEKSCPSDPGLGTTLTTDFTKGESSDWSLADGTSMSYGALGAEFVIAKGTEAPTVSSEKYIMFGKVDVTLRACAGTGTVSSFILESDDLDEIDWEWLGSTDNSVESNFFGKGNTTTYDRAVYHPVASPIENFVTYSIEWTAESIIWSIAGATVRTLAYGDALALGGKNYPQTPMRIKMGNWVGCLDAAAASNPATEGTCQWAGGYLNLAQGPFTMYVQSVTIQDYGNCAEYAYGDMSGSYQSITCNGKADSSSSSSSSDSSSSDSSTSATSSASVSASASASASSSSDPSTTSGNVLVETSSSVANSSTSSSAAASTTSSAAAATTTLSQITSTDSSSASKTTSGSGTASSSGVAQTTSSDANALALNHRYGFIDLSVMVLGLGVGYLVM